MALFAENGTGRSHRMPMNERGPFRERQMPVLPSPRYFFD